MSALLNPFIFGGGPPAPPPGPTDPFFDQVVLLMGFEGALPEDESPLAQAVTVYGGVGDTITSTEQAKYGSQSLRLADFGDTGLSVPDNAAFDLGTTPFTMECFVRFRSALVSGNLYPLMQHGTVSGDFAWQFYIQYRNATQFRIGYYQEDPSLNASFAVTPNITYALDTWYHMATDFDGTKYRVYLDGVMRASDLDIVTPRTVNKPLTVGCNLDGSDNILNRLWDAYLDEVRITIGTARYASDSGFTPPTAPFPRS